MNVPKSSIYLVLVLALISGLLIGSLIGCNEKKHIDPPVLGPAAGSGPVGGGDTQSIILFASPSETIPVVSGQQGVVRITALIENNIGQPMPDGTAVYWSATIGEISPITSTSSNGSSDVTLTFPQAYSGCSVVTARSGDTQASITVCVTEATPTPAPTAAPTAVPTAAATATPATPFLMVSANPTTLTTIPGATSTINACAYDATGTPVAGVIITLTVSLGPGTLTNFGGTTGPDGCIASGAPGTDTLTENNTGTIIVTGTAAGYAPDSVTVTVNP